MNGASDQTVIAALAGVLSHRIQEWYGANAVLDSTSITLRKYPYSFFIGFLIKTSASDQTLLVKIHRKPMIHTLAEASATERLQKLARNEYEISQMIWRAFEEESSPDCEVVQYLDYWEEWNALLMRQVKGKMLKEYLLHPSIVLRRSKAMERLRSFVSLSAKWLRIFHRRISGLQTVPFPVEDARLWMKDVLSKLEVHSNDQVDVAPYRKVLEDTLENLQALTVSVGLLHADFQFSNILITSEGGVCVLDYSLNHRGPIYFDLATIMIDPQTRKVQILTGGRFLTPRLIQTCRKSILDSYFNGEPYCEDVLNFYCVLAILNKWSADEAEFSIRPSLMNRAFAQMTRRYYADTLQQYL
jgi:thiamine kinase-like enzyme